ncbi:MAG: tandem-95 repeat protein [Planctomycetes bacterium]|nr:tandem-95 repeat protein [Planctomycetota bacterium]
MKRSNMRGRTWRRPLVVELLEDRRLLNVQMAPALGQMQVDPATFDPGVVLVRFEPGAVQPGQQLAPGVEVGAALPLVNGLYRVNLQPGVGVDVALATLRGRADVVYAQPNYRVHALVTPNDPLFSQQYDLDNTGQTGGLNDADIDAPEAWDQFTGSSSVIVAVIDTGVDYNHPDLAANMWTNPGEIAGNGVDDDGNGFVDDVHGYDFANNDGNPMDDFGHGTHVAGTIGAVTDNGVGIAGIAWNVKIMAVKFLGADGSGGLDTAIDALNYAVSNGATISNNSWGGGGYYAPLNDAIAAAANQGHIFVAAAGNAGSNNDLVPGYPASYELDNIISVAATDKNDQLASFSNYGASSVDLGAPGVDILSTVPTSGQLGDPSGYATLSGTSMASPHVAGVVALVRGQHPEWSYQQVISQVLGTVDPVANLSQVTATGGRLNAAAALGGQIAVKGPRVTAATPYKVTPGPVDTAIVTFDKAIDPSTFTLDDVVSFTGPAGPIAVTGLQAVANSNDRQFQFSFASQTGLGDYDLVIGPDIFDPAGVAMNQDNDTANGEAIEDQFHLRFTISDTVVFHSTDVPVTIDPTWSAVSVINVDSDFTIADVNVTLNLTHPNTGDLLIYLGHPTGALIRLTDRSTLGANLESTTFDDQASQSIAQGTAPYTGTFRPIDPLGTLNERSSLGQWGLLISNQGAMAGTLNSWSLTITPGNGYTPGDPGDPAPPPTDPGDPLPPPGDPLPPPGDPLPPPGDPLPPPGDPLPPPGDPLLPPGDPLPPPPTNHAPIATDDPAITNEDAPVVVNVLGNDSDLDGDFLFVVSIDWSVGGTALINPDQTVTFTPAANFNGSASFGYTISDGQATASAIARLEIIPINDAPQAVNDVVVGFEDAAQIINVLANDTDPDGDALSVASIDFVTGGAAVINADQTVTFTPAANYVGSATIGYTISDGQASSSATVWITLQPVNDAPLAVSDLVSTYRNTPITIWGSQLTGNDTDADGDFLWVVAVGGAIHGQATFQAGQIVFAPDPGFTGWASFEYTVSDGQAVSVGRVDVNVRAVSYFSTNVAGTLVGSDGSTLPVAPADLVSLTVETDGAFAYKTFFQGSDVGLTTAGENIDAFTFLADGSILISTLGSFTVPGPAGTSIKGAGEDVLRFFPSTLGADTAGTWSLYFDGSDVGLSGSAENVDALAVLPDGRILISTSGAAAVPGVSAQDEDLLVFTPTSLGASTSGLWSLYFDGSDVGLATNAGEDVDGLYVEIAPGSGLPTLHFSTVGNFAVAGAAGGPEDVFAFRPTSLGQNTAGTFGSDLSLDASQFGLTGLGLDGIALGIAPGQQPLPGPLSSSVSGAGAAPSANPSAVLPGIPAAISSPPSPQLTPAPALTSAAIDAIFASPPSQTATPGDNSPEVLDWLDLARPRRRK